MGGWKTDFMLGEWYAPCSLSASSAWGKCAPLCLCLFYSSHPLVWHQQSAFLDGTVLRQCCRFDLEVVAPPPPLGCPTGYSLPLEGFLYHRPKGKLRLLMDLSTSFDDVWVEQLETRVVLPEGARNIKPTVSDWVNSQQL